MQETEKICRIPFCQVFLCSFVLVLLFFVIFFPPLTLRVFYTVQKDKDFHLSMAFRRATAEMLAAGETSTIERENHLFFSFLKVSKRDRVGRDRVCLIV